jgi:hypothetical protein
VADGVLMTGELTILIGPAEALPATATHMAAAKRTAFIFTVFSLSQISVEMQAQMVDHLRLHELTCGS